MNWLIVFTFWLIPFLSINRSEPQLFRTNTGTITFISEAPLETITAASETLKGIIDVNAGTFAFSVPIKSFNGFNSQLQQEHFNENYMETAKFPNATFTGKIIEAIDFSAVGLNSVRAKGAFTIHGVKQERLIKANLEVKNNSMIITSTFFVALTDHDITIPKIVQQKISPEIEVTVKAILYPALPE